VAKCPVCGMTVEETESTLKTEHMGKVFYFCSQGCKSEFDKDPHKYMESEHKQHFHSRCC